MSKREPTVRTVDANEVARTWSKLLNDVAESHDRVIVERDGTPVAAVISAADLERFRRLEGLAHFLDDREVAVSLSLKDVPIEEIEREAAKALAEVRAEVSQERQDAASRPT